MTKTDSLLISIYRLADGTLQIFTIEEIVVNAFHVYPKMFSMNNFPEHPDSAQIEKRIYDNLQPKGYIRVINRKVQLTNYGLEKCRYIIKISMGKNEKQKRLNERELMLYKKLLNLDGFKIFLNNKKEQPIDIDIYQFYNISVRTKTSLITSKINIVHSLLKKADKFNIKFSDELIKYKLKLDNLFKEIQNDKN